MPTLAYPQPLADGAVFTGPGLMRIYDGNSRASRNLVGRYTPGSDPGTDEVICPGSTESTRDAGFFFGIDRSGSPRLLQFL